MKDNHLFKTMSCSTDIREYFKRKKTLNFLSTPGSPLSVHSIERTPNFALKL